MGIIAPKISSPRAGRPVWITSLGGNGKHALAETRPIMNAFQFYDSAITAELVSRRVMGALEKRVLSAKSVELRGYFQNLAASITSPLDGGPPEEDGITGASDEEIEQTALLLCHHDGDGDGLLAPAEFAAVIELVASQAGVEYSPDHIEKTFAQCDIDRSGFIDLNELLLLRQRKVM